MSQRIVIAVALFVSAGSTVFADPIAINASRTIFWFRVFRGRVESRSKHGRWCSKLDVWNLQRESCCVGAN